MPAGRAGRGLGSGDRIQQRAGGRSGALTASRLHSSWPRFGSEADTSEGTGIHCCSTPLSWQLPWRVRCSRPSASWCVSGRPWTSPPTRASAPSWCRTLLRRRLWWAGTAAAVTGYAFQAVALAYGSLLLVAPLLVSALLFALPLSARLAHRRVTRAEWGWAVPADRGTGRLRGAGPHQARRLRRFGTARRRWSPGSACCSWRRCLAVAVRLSDWRRAILLAVGVGVLFGVVAVLTKIVMHIVTEGSVSRLVTSPLLYVLIVVGVIATLLQQSAFHAGSLRASVPAMLVLEPMVAVLLGEVVLGEHLAVDKPSAVVLAVAVASHGRGDHRARPRRGRLGGRAGSPRVKADPLSHGPGLGLGHDGGVMLSSDPLGQIAQGPAGPTVGAFFDLDGTLVAGFTGDRARQRPDPPPAGPPRRGAGRHRGLVALQARPHAVRAAADARGGISARRVAGRTRRDRRAVVLRAGVPAGVSADAGDRQGAPGPRTHRGAQFLGADHPRRAGCPRAGHPECGVQHLRTRRRAGCSPAGSTGPSCGDVRKPLRRNAFASRTVSICAQQLLLRRRRRGRAADGARRASRGR